MQFKLFSIPATGDATAEEELNKFLRSHRAVSVEKHLVQNGATAFNRNNNPGFRVVQSLGDRQIQIYHPSPCPLPCYSAARAGERG